MREFETAITHYLIQSFAFSFPVTITLNLDVVTNQSYTDHHTHMLFMWLLSQKLKVKKKKRTLLLWVLVHFSQRGGFEMDSWVWAPCRAEPKSPRVLQLKQTLQQCFERWKEAGATKKSGR